MNLPASAMPAKPVLKTGGATGPLPPPSIDFISIYPASALQPGSSRIATVAPRNENAVVMTGEDASIAPRLRRTIAKSRRAALANAAGILERQQLCVFA